MDELHKLLQETLEGICTPDRLLAALLKRKFRALGLTLSDDQVVSIDNQVNENSSETIHIDLTDEQVATLSGNSSIDAIEVTDSDIEDFSSQLYIVIDEATTGAIESFAHGLVSHWLEETPERLAEHRAINRSFESRLRAVWKNPLVKLESLIAICLQFGGDFNSEFRPEASNNSDLVFEALTRLHARACQIAGEAFVLLRSGYADGAMARWRTLHEVCVTALYIRQEGQPVAERYLAHQFVTEYEDARVYQEHCSALGYEPIDEATLAELKAVHDTVCSKYGKAFQRKYGWVPQALNANGQVQFHHVEQAVDLSALKPFVMLAHSRIHAGAHASYHSLGMHPYGKEALVAGQSMFGLGTPAQNVAYSLTLTTVTLLLYQPNLDRTATCLALQNFRDKIFDDVASVEDKLVRMAAKDASPT